MTAVIFPSIWEPGARVLGYKIGEKDTASELYPPQEKGLTALQLQGKISEPDLSVGNGEVKISPYTSCLRTGKLYNFLSCYNVLIY